MLRLKLEVKKLTNIKFCWSLESLETFKAVERDLFPTFNNERKVSVYIKESTFLVSIYLNTYFLWKKYERIQSFCQVFFVQHTYNLFKIVRALC